MSSNTKKLHKAVKYAAMASKIRAGVVESMTPAIPYLMRFKISDYTYFIDYVRERVMESVMSAGLYGEYIDAAKELAKDLGEAVPPKAPPTDEISEEDQQDAIFADLSVGEPGVDGEVNEKRTPYMLSNYYGNVWPLKTQRLKMATESKGFWARMRDVPMISVNGVAMTPDQALRAALISMCVNPDALSSWADALDPKPAQVDVEGTLGYEAFPRPAALHGRDVLEAIIVLECTAFINRVRILKEDPEGGWDFPLDYAQVFFRKLFPKRASEWTVKQHQGTYPHLGLEEEALNQFRFPQKVCYVPVLDHRSDDRMGTPAHIPAEILKNFPWDIKNWMKSDNKLTPHEAKKTLAKINEARPLPGKVPYNGALNAKIPTIGATVGEKITDHVKKYEGQNAINTSVSDEWTEGFIEDKFNGGMNLHVRRGGWLLQYFCKVESELWEEVYADTEKTKETQGLRNLLYLFHNRSTQLKGHVNPHYWNKCMKAFFDRLPHYTRSLSSKTDGSILNYTEADLERFRNRMGAKYADVKMGLRLSWVVPSPMPAHGESDPHPSRKDWYTKHEYANEKLLRSYKAIASSPKNKKMQKMFKLDKTHAYAVMHNMPRATWDRPHEDGFIEEPLHDITSTDRVVPEYCFLFPIVETLTDEPIALNPTNWNIQEVDYSLRRTPESTISKLISKMGKDPEFKILLEYIFPINSIIPEIATIYGMEFFKPVAEYMKQDKKYFEGVRQASDTLILSMKQTGNYDFDNKKEPDVDMGKLIR